MTSRICVNNKEEFEDTKGVMIIHKSKKNFVVGSHITLLDGLGGGGGILFNLCPSVRPRYFSLHLSQELLMAEI
jgi:hypothetical protein